MHYATFKQRAYAQMIDALILLAITGVFMWLKGPSKQAEYLLYPLETALLVGYTIFFHGRFGQTIGKRMAGIKLMKANGQSASWKEAWLRDSVGMTLLVPTVICHYIALNAIPDALYASSSWRELPGLLATHEPAVPHWIKTLSTIWFWSELVTMLLNKRRRALHDLLAGTVVVQLAPDTPSAIVPAQ